MISKESKAPGSFLPRTKMSPTQPKAYVGVVSRAHVHKGVAEGFAMLNHGKKAPLLKLHQGDWLIYYSPKVSYPDGAPLKAFTAIGRVKAGEPYQAAMAPGMTGYRKDVAYKKSAHEVPIEDLRTELEFMQKPWGMLARRGMFEISLADAKQIAKAMGIQLH